MGLLIKKLVVKAASKAAKIDMSDPIAQLNADDVVSVIKAILF